MEESQKGMLVVQYATVILLLILKTSGVSLSWLWVFSPFWIPALLIVILYTMATVIGIVAGIESYINE